MKRLLLVLFTPSCWLQNYQYSRRWDEELTYLMRHFKFEATDGHHTTIRGIKLWIANHPYASFSLEEIGVRPKRATILLAHRKMVADYLDAELDKRIKAITI